MDTTTRTYTFKLSHDNECVITDIIQVEHNHNKILIKRFETLNANSTLKGSYTIGEIEELLTMNKIYQAEIYGLRVMNITGSTLEYDIDDNGLMNIDDKKILIQRLRNTDDIYEFVDTVIRKKRTIDILEPLVMVE
jgi:hypothetical protein